jgi:N-methylhydantoinase B
MRRAFRILGDGTFLSLASEKNVMPPFGVFGGTSAWPIRSYIVRDGETVAPGPMPGKVANFPLAAGDLFVVETNGGGGYGDPLERDPERVAQDVRLGYIGNKALSVYGVVIRDGACDQEKTRECRRRLRESRICLTLAERAVPSNEDGLQSGFIHPAVAERLQAQDGDLIECLVPGRIAAPLRLLLQHDDAIEKDTLCLSDSTCKFFGLTAGMPCQVRALPRPDPVLPARPTMHAAA